MTLSCKVFVDYTQRSSYWGPQSWTQHSGGVSEEQGSGLESEPAAKLLLMQPRMQLAFWAAVSHLWVIPSSFHPQVKLCKQSWTQVCSQSRENLVWGSSVVQRLTGNPVWITKEP